MDQTPAPRQADPRTQKTYRQAQCRRDLQPFNPAAAARAALARAVAAIDSKNAKRSKKIQKLRYLIFELKSLQPAEITEIAEALGQSTNTTRDQLRKLIKLELVVRVHFEHHNLYGINGHFNTFIDTVLNGLYD
jgi:Bacterial regulatory protein, arsR family.